MPWWGILLIVLGSLIILNSVFSYITYIYAGKSISKNLSRKTQGFKNLKMDISFYNNGPMKPLADEGVTYLKSLEHEDIYIESFDGLKLHAYYYKNPKGKSNKYFLGMHGFKSGPLHEFGAYAKKYFDLGFNLILPDERAHYLSEGEYLTMGIKERYDVQTWAQFIVTKFGDKSEILIQGVSMGSASVCLASNLALPKQVIGIISDCGYSSIKDQIIYTMKHEFKVPSFPIINFITIYLYNKLGIDFNSESPKEAVKYSKVPILFIHGEKDQFVPVKFVHELYENCGSKKDLYIVKEANHAESVAIDIDKYFDKIKEFFNL